MCSDQSVPRRCIIVLTMHWTLLYCTKLCVQLLSVAVRVLSLLCACDGAMLQNLACSGALGEESNGTLKRSVYLRQVKLQPVRRKLTQYSIYFNP